MPEALTEQEANNTGTLRGLLSLFGQSRQGGIAVVFAMALFAFVMSIGAAFDYARGLNTQTQLQSAVDAAVLAAARNAFATQGDLEVIANAVFEANRPKTMGMNVVSNNFSLSGNIVSYTVAGTLPTTLAAISGTTEFNLNATSSAYRRTDGTEIVIALDTTGSMGFGSSWADAKTAMADMLVELDGLSESQTEFYASLIPFADRVNVGQTRAESWISIASPPPGDWGNKPTTANNTNPWCLEPRDEMISGNPNALTDKSPSALSFTPSATNRWQSYLAYKTFLACPSQSIMGPTADISGFVSAIESIPLDGTGRFDVGMAWAYRMLSPNWQGMWGVGGYPAAYGDRRKIAVFISDAYTEAYRHEVPNQTDSTENSVFGWNQGSTLGFENMVEVCNRMKANGIEVHTIYVNGNANGIPYMKQCSTDETSYYHSVSDISELQNALRNIASSVVQVGLTN